MLHKASLHSRSSHKDLGEAKLFLWIEGRSSKVKVIIFNVTTPSKGILHQSREAEPVGPAQRAHKEWGILCKMTKERYRWRIGSRVKSQGQVPALLLTPNCGMTVDKIYLSPLRASVSSSITWTVGTMWSPRPWQLANSRLLHHLWWLEKPKDYVTKSSSMQ